MAFDKQQKVTIKNTKKIFPFHVRVNICLVIFILFYSAIDAQVNIEAVARLHFTITANPNRWLEGFQSYLSGPYSPYQSHRSGMNRDSAFVARTSGSEAMIEWNTAAIPLTLKEDSASFIWVCGFGNNLGNEWYDLNINDSNMVSFSTKNDSYWSVIGSKGIHLSFTTVFQNSNGANFGYMVLTVPRSLLSKGKALRISIHGRVVENENWYRLFAYRDALKYSIEHEQKKIYTVVEFIHMGDATLTLCAPKKNTNASIKLYNSNTVIAEGRLQSDGVMSKAKIFIPRYLQPTSNSNTIIEVDGKSIDTIYWNDINNRRILAFMDEEIECNRYVFPPGAFPEFYWKNEILVENELGEFPLNVMYFNSDFQQVISADRPGRYGAVIEGITPSGFVIKRYATLFCSDVDFDDYSKNVPIKMNKLPEYRITDSNWERYSMNEERFSFGSLKYFPQNNSDAAVFLAGLNEIVIQNDKYDTPRIKDRQWWITMKGKLEGKLLLQKSLLAPKIIENDSSAFLIDSIQFSSNYDKTNIEKLKTLCIDWAERGEVSNVTLIVHKGKIIFYDAFGLDENGKLMNKDSKVWMASITKLLTGVLMMQFVDQKIIDLDAPVGLYLPELKGISNDKLTVRNLFNHTSGLQFAGEWASDWNIALENQIAQILPLVNIGESFAYHRVGYALAGKIIERITEIAVPYQFQKYIFSPLGMNSAYSDNTYGGLYCTAIDLARFGQMLLNKGKYNGYQLYSEQSFEKMLPKKLSVSDHSWGIGTTQMEGNGLSETAFGHGSASGTVFRIDPKNDLIIISARNKPGKSHDDFENALIEICISLVNNH